MRKSVKTMATTGFVLIIGMFLFGANVRAYIDPSVTTYLIQAIAGVVIAAGAIIGIYFRRTKKKVSEKLGIDENRNKTVESDDIIIKQDDPASDAAEDKKE